MTGTIVGVLRGGPSQEHEVSLRTGHTILSHLLPERFHGRDIFIDRTGTWYDRGRPVEPEKVLRQIDVAINALHGEYGESGELQRLLERHGVPYTGADAFGSFLAMHKLMAKMRAKELGFLVPEFRYVDRPEAIDDVVIDAVRSFHQPMIVKPVDSGSSEGVSKLAGFVAARAAVESLLARGARGVLIEEYIRGKEATAGIVEGLRGEELYALPVVEIVPPGDDFFSFDAKYSGKTEEIVPGRFPRAIAEEVQRIARIMHTELGQRHYSRSDFLIAPRGIYFLETNSAAAVGLTSESLLPKSLAAVGVRLSDFLSHIVDLARTKK